MEGVYKETLDIVATSGEIYNIVCGLRGPDSGNKYLKYIFTSRLRGIIGVYGVNVREESTIEFEDIVNAILTMEKHDEHYLNHMYWSFKCLYEISENREALFLSKLAEILDSMVFIENEASVEEEILGRDLSKHVVRVYDNCFRELNSLLKHYSEFVR